MKDKTKLILYSGVFYVMFFTHTIFMSMLFFKKLPIPPKDMISPVIAGYTIYVMSMVIFGIIAMYYEALVKNEKL